VGSVVAIFRSDLIPQLLLIIFHRPAKNSRSQFNRLALFDRAAQINRSSIVDHGLPSLRRLCFAIVTSALGAHGIAMLNLGKSILFAS
jgi:hypothetical protein